MSHHCSYLHYLRVCLTYWFFLFLMYLKIHVCQLHSDLWHFVGSSSFPYQSPTFLNTNICCHLLFLFSHLVYIFFFSYFFEVLVLLLIFSYSGQLFALHIFFRARWGRKGRRLELSYWCIISMLPLHLCSQSVDLTAAFNFRKPPSLKFHIYIFYLSLSPPISTKLR